VVLSPGQRRQISVAEGVSLEKELIYGRLFQRMNSFNSIYIFLSALEDNFKIVSLINKRIFSFLLSLS